MRILFIGSAVADDAFHDDQRRLVGTSLERFNRLGKCSHIVGIVNMLNVPAHARKLQSHVFTERQRRVAFDRDLVVVIDPTKV